ncbi:MAG: siroheme synthase [Beijerinckiaceae bacterium]|nr:siroheme synthase [Beijerinckiaceae bacterium]
MSGEQGQPAASEPHYTGYAPSGSDPARIASLAVLPVFFKLQGKRVVLAGGSAGAAWKAELLVAAGALVDVYAPEASDEMLAIVAAHPDTVRHFLRPWSIDVLNGAAMAIGAIEEEAEGQAFRCAAKFAGVPVNVVDRPRFCDFSFGAIVNRSPLVIGISTDGAAPVLGQAVRARIDALLPSGFQRWAQAARDWRAAVKASGLSFGARREFWRIFTSFAVANPQAPPEPSQRTAWLAKAGHAESAAAGKGSIVFVGIGDGDPENLTMKAVRMLQSADVIVYDHAPAGILDLARREARKIDRSKGDAPGIVELALAGSRVIRLCHGRAEIEAEAVAAEAHGLDTAFV